MAAHARKAIRKVAAATLEALVQGEPAGGTLPPVEASRVLPLQLAKTFPRTLVYTRQDVFVDEHQRSPYVERRRLRLSVELQAKASSGDGSQDQLDDWAQEIEDAILRVGAERTQLEAAGLGANDRVEKVLSSDSDATAADTQQPLTGLVIGFDVFYLHQPGDRTGFAPASAIKMDGSEDGVPEVGEGDVQSETPL